MLTDSAIVEDIDSSDFELSETSASAPASVLHAAARYAGRATLVEVVSLPLVVKGILNYSSKGCSRV